MEDTLLGIVNQDKDMSLESQSCRNSDDYCYPTGTMTIANGKKELDSRCC